MDAKETAASRGELPADHTASHKRGNTSPNDEYKDNKVKDSDGDHNINKSDESPGSASNLGVNVGYIAAEDDVAKSRAPRGKRVIPHRPLTSTNQMKRLAMPPASGGLQVIPQLTIMSKNQMKARVMRRGSGCKLVIPPRAEG